MASSSSTVSVADGAAPPTVALVGRPNVGKSTLFNRLVGHRQALVANHSGLTRDRQYGLARRAGESFRVVDTGGMGEASEGVSAAMEQQALHAVEEADAVILVVDARAGLAPGDEVIVERLRRARVPFLIAVNKADGLSPAEACAEFHGLGVEPRAVSATRGHGIPELVEEVLLRAREARRGNDEDAPEDAASRSLEEEEGIPLAVIGRPNVGKSTLVNRLLGDERVIVYDEPGTTRDQVRIPLERDGVRYTLIDTAGVRRRARVHGTVEKFSVGKALEAIEAASVVALVVDAREGITEQDGHLAGHIVDAGRGVVVVVNKWDGLPPEQKQAVRRQLDLRLPFLSFAAVHWVSALHGSGVGHILDSVARAHHSAGRSIPTAELNELLARAVAAHAPPAARGRRIKLRYAHQGGHYPPVIVVHGNQTARVPAAYRRYLENFFRDELGLEGTPLRVELRTGENPFAGRSNPLTPRQRRNRERVIRHDRRRRRKRR